MAPFKTWIDGHESQPARELAPIAPYKIPDDVPVPLRHTLKQAYESGLTVENLALVFELPAAWVELFVRDAEGKA
jgi:hypothetical protein